MSIQVLHKIWWSQSYVVVLVEKLSSLYFGIPEVFGEILCPNWSLAITLCIFKAGICQSFLSELLTSLISKICYFILPRFALVVSPAVMYPFILDTVAVSLSDSSYFSVTLQFRNFFSESTCSHASFTHILVHFCLQVCVPYYSLLIWHEMQPIWEPKNVVGLFYIIYVLQFWLAIGRNYLNSYLWIL